nr:unnamed protein product [Callosobruchus chinensis]
MEQICNIAKRVFQRSNALLLGDEGYGIAPWLMVPFGNPNTLAEHAYNNLFTKERVIIERCFGQLKQLRARDSEICRTRTSVI